MPPLAKARRVAHSSPGRAPHLWSGEGDRNGVPSFCLSSLGEYTVSTRLRNSGSLLSTNTNLSPQNLWSWQQILASFCSPDTHTPGCWRDLIVQISCDLGSFCVPKMLSLQITFPSCVAPLKIPSARKWQRRGPAKIQTSKLEVPSLTQTFRWRPLGSVRSSWECAGRPWGCSLTQFAAGCPACATRTQSHNELSP